MKNIFNTIICIVLSIQLSKAQQNIAVADSTIAQTEEKKESNSSNEKIDLVFVYVIGAVVATVGATVALAAGNIVGSSGPKIVKKGIQFVF